MKANPHCDAEEAVGANLGFPVSAVGQCDPKNWPIDLKNYRRVFNINNYQLNTYLALLLLQSTAQNTKSLIRMYIKMFTYLSGPKLVGMSFSSHVVNIRNV